MCLRKCLTDRKRTMRYNRLSNRRQTNTYLKRHNCRHPALQVDQYEAQIIYISVTYNYLWHGNIETPRKNTVFICLRMFESYTPEPDTIKQEIKAYERIRTSCDFNIYDKLKIRKQIRTVKFIISDWRGQACISLLCLFSLCLPELTAFPQSGALLLWMIETIAGPQPFSPAHALFVETASVIWRFPVYPGLSRI